MRWINVNHLLPGYDLISVIVRLVDEAGIVSFSEATYAEGQWELIDGNGQLYHLQRAMEVTHWAQADEVKLCTVE